MKKFPIACAATTLSLLFLAVPATAATQPTDADKVSTIVKANPGETKSSVTVAIRAYAKTSKMTYKQALDEAYKDAKQVQADNSALSTMSGGNDKHRIKKLPATRVGPDSHNGSYPGGVTASRT